MRGLWILLCLLFSEPSSSRTPASGATDDERRSAPRSQLAFLARCRAFWPRLYKPCTLKNGQSQSLCFCRSVLSVRAWETAVAERRFVLLRYPLLSCGSLHLGRLL
uniref:Putative secreted protein n=1 Tax=Ixodes ricinus TaxID=34613 RepID=A0A147BV27_IXORI